MFDSHCHLHDERMAQVEFAAAADGVMVSVTFDPENAYPIEQQRAGWQAILGRFARHVTGGGRGGA